MIINKLNRRTKRNKCRYTSVCSKPITKAELNNNFKYTLMNLYDSWDDIALSKIILLDEEYWELGVIVDHISNQLNHSNMENPFPIFPNNPFNRKLFTIDALIKLKKKLIINKSRIHITLKLLLKQPKKVLSTYYFEAQNHSSNFSSSLLQLFTKKLRFMMINELTSQSLYNGIWVPTKYPLNNFEILYNKFKEIPYQIEFDDNIIENPCRDLFFNVLLLHDGDKFDTNENDFCEKITRKFIL